MHCNALVNFKDVPTGLINVGRKDRDIVDEEGVSQSEDAQDEEQKAFVMSKPDGEVRYQQQSLTLDGSIPSNTQFFGRCMLRCCHLQKVHLPKVNLRQNK